MNIDDIPAGRKMDALIAKKVTGWKAHHWAEKCDGHKFIQCGACGQLGHGNCYGNGQGQIQIICGEYVARCQEAELPEYSTNIAAVWEVVELFRQGRQPQPSRDSVACVIEMTISDCCTSEDCLCVIYSPTLAKVEATANEMSLAICRAALKAVRI